MQSKIGLPPKELYEMLTQPDNTRIFRSIKVGTRHADTGLASCNRAKRQLLVAPSSEGR